MKLIRDGFVGSALLVASGLGLIFAFDWDWTAGTRILALAAAGLWIYIFVGHTFVIRAHVQGEIDASFNNLIQQPLSFPQQLPQADERQSLSLIDAPIMAERLIPTYSPSTAQPRSEPMMVPTAATQERMIELPDGIQLPRRDVAYFVDNLDAKGHGRKNWVGTKMPSGKVVDTLYMQPLIAAVRMTGEFPKYGQGIKAIRTLTTGEIKQRLHLD